MIEVKPLSDLDELLAWRKEVIETVFNETPSQSLLEANKEYYEKHVDNGSHLPFLAYVDDTKAGSGSICLTEELPSPDNPSGRCAYLMNIYVREPFRTHGVGHAIVKKLLEEALNRNCGKIYLETTDSGRPVYESMGFHDLPDMMKFDSNYEKNDKDSKYK